MARPSFVLKKTPLPARLLSVYETTLPGNAGHEDWLRGLDLNERPLDFEVEFAQLVKVHSSDESERER